MRFLVFRPPLAQVISFVALNGFLTACATISIGSHYDENTNLVANQTFSSIIDP